MCKPSENVFMQIDPSFLVHLGALTPVRLLHFEIYRVFTAQFIILNLVDYLFSMITVISVASIIEHCVDDSAGPPYFRGARLILSCWVLSGVQGGFTLYPAPLFRCYFSLPEALVLTPQNCQLGLFGIVFAFLVLNFEQIPNAGSYTCLLVMLLIMIILLGTSTAYISAALACTLDVYAPSPRSRSPHGPLPDPRIG